MRSILSLIGAIIILGMTYINSNDLRVTSVSFRNNGIIPVKYSCEGSDINPPLHIENIPANAISLAVIMHDPDASGKNGFTHWVLWNVGPDGNVPENYREGEQGVNSAEKNGYKGMCPPDGVHHYHFRVYALNTRLHLDQNTTKDILEKAMKGHILAQGELVGLYKMTKEGVVK